MNDKFIYRCINCGSEYSAGKIIYLCPSCSSRGNQLPPKGVLKVVYDYAAISGKIKDFNGLAGSGFFDLLPIASLKSLPPLQIGNTPLYKISKLDDRNLPFSLFLKDDSQNPTFSLKDRASALVSAFAKEKSLNTIVAASTGNAGSSIAGICASQNQKAVVIVPASAPAAKLTQIVMYGAKVIPVAGSYDDAFDLSIMATEEFGWYNRNTAFNPLTIEGKKTVAFELFSQLNCVLPDRIFIPVGDGVIISGVYKGFEDLLNLKLIDRMPVLVAVQAEGSSNLVRNLGSAEFKPQKSKTIADSISVDYPRNFFMAKNFINNYKGETVTVSDQEILAASKKLAENTGIFSEPAAAAAFAGFLKFQRLNKIAEGSTNVILLTGSGLKDIASVQPLIKLPVPFVPDIRLIADIFMDD